MSARWHVTGVSEVTREIISIVKYVVVVTCVNEGMYMAADTYIPLTLT